MFTDRMYQFTTEGPPRRRIAWITGLLALALAALLWSQSPLAAVGPGDYAALAQESIAFTKLPDPAVLPPGSALAVAFNHDSTYLAVGLTHQIANQPFLVIYKREGDTFTRLAGPDVQPNSIVGAVEFSYDSTYLAVTSSREPEVLIYKRSGDTFTKLPDPDVLLPHSGLDVAFNSDATYLAVGHNNSPYVTIYKRSGDIFTKLPNPVGLPGGNGQSVAFSRDDAYLAVGHFAFDPPYLALYERDGDTFTKLPAAADQPPGPGSAVAFSPDGTHMVLGHSTNTSGMPGGVFIYTWDEGTLTKLPGPDVPPPGLGRDVAYSADGAYLAVSHTSGARVTIYSRSGDSYTKLPDPDVPPPGANGYAVTFSHDTGYMVLGHNVEPYITIYKIGPTPQRIYLPSVLR